MGEDTLDAQQPGGGPPDEDALFVLTAAMLTPGQFPGVLGDDYPAACAELGLDPLDTGYGLVFGQDGTGARWTVATTDAAMVACALAAWDCGLEYDLSPDEAGLAASLPGWPLPVAVAAPGVPAPYDPDEETGGRPALTPPDTSVWGPPQRRLGADEIAVRWREWRDQFDAAGTAEEPVDAKEAGPAPQAPGEDGDANEPGAAAQTAGAAEAGPGGAQPRAGLPAVSHDGVRRVLESAEAYVREPPPPGRVRAAYGAVRADGPGWSLVARTDDMAFVLLDDAPGEVLPVGRGPSLPPLLEALGRLAGVTSS
jgi:hypothetical protein